MNSLLDQWQASWRKLGVEVPDRHLHDALLQRYDEAHRHYHTRQHLVECLAHFADLAAFAEHPAEVALALWFHDAIYDVRRHDNEECSADWAQASLLEAGVAEQVARRVHGLIMATRHRVLPQGADEQAMIDADLAILGAAPQRFDEYERQIREEYVHIPDDVFRSKRVGILKEFLRRTAIFSAVRFRERYERQARENIERSVQRLTKGTDKEM